MHPTKPNPSISSLAGNACFGVFIIYFAAFSLGNTNENFAPLDIYFKHAAALVAGIISLTFFPIQLLFSCLLFSPIALLYLFADLPQYALMCLVFSAALPCFGQGIYYALERYGLTALAALSITFLIPMCIGMVRQSDGVFWTYNYGRPRLLLGYWHPKEAAIALAIPVVFAGYIFRDRVFRFILLASPLLLFTIGSRGTALGVSFIFVLAYFPRATFYLASSLLCIFLLFLASSDDAFLLLDKASSYRLSLWKDALVWPDYTPGSEFMLDRYSVDSFYVEMISMSGSISLVLLASWFLLISTLIIWSGSNLLWRFAVLGSIFLVSAFDSGLVSTGNAYHVFAWSFVVLPILRAFCLLNTMPYIAPKSATFPKD